MGNHGKHCGCPVCSAGKSVGMIKRCDDDSCQHESHTEEEMQTEEIKEE